MTWFKQKSFIFAMILLIFISIIINFFFSNSVTHIIVTVFLGIETLWIISIFKEIVDNGKRLSKFIEAYIISIFIITIFASYLLY
ncbi:hypothetical protein BJM51_05420 [Listeria monocytogenes]|uniref:Uncharacterized protein n=1 Tax=Listeria monocytogenes TaxID=1639 RepID=A0A461DLC1_LISMN|nr:hypothetical protein [Listeria monocytogenes]EAC3358403.1 hypothetical protein [Listeria monocytogenes]EAC3422267.1 hypothetical protein [Listeria monocytogenes]EAC3449493.1 hypothetical protein [Listeria monocytogenes]EAC3746705.1 hypothetical protein [Listeria monocytogenes]